MQRRYSLEWIKGVAMQTAQRDRFDADVGARRSAVLRIDRIDRSSDDRY